MVPPGYILHKCPLHPVQAAPTLIPGHGPHPHCTACVSTPIFLHPMHGQPQFPVYGLCCTMHVGAPIPTLSSQCYSLPQHSVICLAGQLQFPGSGTGGRTWKREGELRVLLCCCRQRGEGSDRWVKAQGSQINSSQTTCIPWTPTGNPDLGISSSHV